MASASARAIIQDDPVVLVQPTEAVYDSFVHLSKSIVDPIAHSVSAVQQQRLQENRKRKRGGDERQNAGAGEVLRLKQVYTEGFRFEQIWAQAQQVVDATAREIEGLLAELQASNTGISSKHGAQNRHDTDVGPQEYSTHEYDPDIDTDFEDDGAQSFVEEEDDIVDEDLMSGLEDGEDVEEEDESPGDEGEDFVQDTNGLNDGFFSIDAFNKQSEFLERQDARGDVDDGAASDEEDIDWAADPLAEDSAVARNSKGLSSQQNGGEDDDAYDDEDDEDANGPTFGDIDLDAPEGASDEEALQDDGIGDLDTGNANNIMYADFFAPPARKASKKRGRPHPHNFPQRDRLAADGEELDEDVERAMKSVQNDLFPSEDEEDLEDDQAVLDPGDPKSRRSAHERRQAALAEEIRKLEAENVSKRKWTLAGEARAADRPLNSLLEEDLDFERVGKPIAPITQEINDDIEAMIKRRILAREFDEVIRRRPDSLTALAPRRGKLDFELSDQKSGKGLAEEYEEEHLRRTDPNFVDVKDEKLKKDHRESEALWKDVSAKLDALSSWHYKPRPVQPSLEVRVDAPALALEDARPTAGGDVALASALAPQEVYRPGETKTSGEVVTKGGMPIAKDELSREQKKRRRMREKERAKKAGANTTSITPKAEKRHREQSNIIGDLKKGGVKVIGKKGELRDVDGNAADKRRQTSNAGFLKL